MKQKLIGFKIRTYDIMSNTFTVNGSSILNSYIVAINIDTDGNKLHIDLENGGSITYPLSGITELMYETIIEE